MTKYREWALNILCWDGVLPVAVITVPKIVMLLFPMMPGARELTFIIVPVTAFVIRYVNGRMRFRSGELYIWQLVVFFMALCVLFVFDAILTMMQLVQKGVPREAYLTAGVIYLIYLSLMAIALFPARKESTYEFWPNDTEGN
jgi:hypothetical protein